MEYAQCLLHITAREGTTRKEQVDKQVKELEFKAGNSEAYKVEPIGDSAVYASKSESGQLPGLYYLVAWKKYLKKENTWKPSFAVQYLKKLINSFHKDYPEKPTTTSLPIDAALSMARPTVKPTSLKRKRGRPAGGASKRAKNWV